MTVGKASLLTVFSLSIVALTAWGTYSIANSIFTPRTSGSTLSPVPSGSKSPVKLVDAESYCPLNGKKYTQAEQTRWEQLRPAAVMIENHPDARPQSGLSYADVVYEAVAEGGITRFMAIFLCDEPPQWVGPVRSARTYFLDWVSEYNSLYAHVGGANTPGRADALSQIQTYGIKSINEIPLGQTNSLKAGFQRITDPAKPVSLEHTMYLNVNQLRQFAIDQFKWGVTTDGARWDSTFEKWKFADTKTQGIPSNAKDSEKIAYEFWQNQGGGANVEWTYQSDTNTYARKMNDSFHNDKVTGKQIEISTVIVQLQTEERAGDGYPGDLHLLYGTIGSGDGYMLRDGKVFPIKWEKSGRTARTKFKNSTGTEIPLSRGKIWISTIPTYSKEFVMINGQSVTAPTNIGDTDE